VRLVEPDDVLGGSVSRGREAFIRNSRKWFARGTTSPWNPSASSKSGDRVLVFVRLRGGAHASGVPLGESIAHVWSLRGTRAEALHVSAD
jgi:hypothetical protein